jgi:hypothetical protein
MTNTTRTLTFRTESDRPVFELRTTTPAEREVDGAHLYVLDGAGRPSVILDGLHVEELHQFTHDMLAGPMAWRPEPVDAHILCGTRSPGGNTCALADGHQPVTDECPHVTPQGSPFFVPGENYPFHLIPDF